MIVFGTNDIMPKKCHNKKGRFSRARNKFQKLAKTLMFAINMYFENTFIGLIHFLQEKDNFEKQMDNQPRQKFEIV